MKITSILLAGIISLVLFALVTPASAVLSKENNKEITITGDAKCAKCVLKEADKCQTVIQAQQDGKTVNYYLADNDVSKSFHENVCKETKKVTATGSVQTVNGKLELTATKIELVK